MPDDGTIYRNSVYGEHMGLFEHRAQFVTPEALYPPEQYGNAYAVAEPEVLSTTDAACDMHAE